MDFFFFFFWWCLGKCDLFTSLQVVLSAASAAASGWTHRTPCPAASSPCECISVVLITSCEFFSSTESFPKVLKVVRRENWHNLASAMCETLFWPLLRTYSYLIPVKALKGLATQSVVLGPAVSASPGHLWVMKDLSTSLRHTKPGAVA